ncbi:hypothetical protein HNR67_007458 [Crossiella cryophila]|uniref:Uncharacterized protein n=1 Tax=Crossiella cryophila TaxID=43355 RepID=A0A7W7CHG6_9PSEU|nr:hypothetical protein [Crossiella cryophila]
MRTMALHTDRRQLPHHFSRLAADTGRPSREHSTLGDA